jgi:predicted RNA binding protein YcfA (HicA-like mRNA interferase family)
MHVLAALIRIGWSVKRQRGSHKLLSRSGWPDYEFAFHDHDEICGRMLARVAKVSRASVPSVSIATARTGQSSKVDVLGMRPMQQRAWSRRGEQ